MQSRCFLFVSSVQNLKKSVLRTLPDTVNNPADLRRRVKQLARSVNVCASQRKQHHQKQGQNTARGFTWRSVCPVLTRHTATRSSSQP
ncbi:hypothetical protein E2R62_23615 [Citrobacter rodentium]|uniref:Uncharacterized protein n=1 Tax=Citrobacter rodentium TaxID=67825 RepID=A0A482PV80_CITRO|nr:hypothetical protein E2R62_23615 [Citrobacter rodentium]HAT8013713.1 hypothetical protein [Citrobacter rodentium NBRC 105723 = DSM 16636]HAT8018792.1 hypothetical protein [Citrobacter rodentium]HAT8028397.1 hypothetical protein [Citrobacter rodentium]HAT8033627.1 hypothetical protein [Citrobacter rodentium]